MEKSDRWSFGDVFISHLESSFRDRLMAAPKHGKSLEAEEIFRDLHDEADFVSPLGIKATVLGKLRTSPVCWESRMMQTYRT